MPDGSEERDAWDALYCGVDADGEPILGQWRADLRKRTDRMFKKNKEFEKRSEFRNSGILKLSRGICERKSEDVQGVAQ